MSYLRTRPFARYLTISGGIAVVVIGIFLIVSHHHPLPLLTRGEVVAKGYDPPRDWILMEDVGSTTCTEVGTVEDCIHTPVMIPIPEHDDEQWWVRIKVCGPAASTPHGECRTRDVITTRQDHDAVQIGQTYSTN